LARTLFYDFPVTPCHNEMLPEKEERLCFKERPLRMEAALSLMASHWPPENLPMREVELWAGYTIAWMQHLLRAGNITDDTLPDLCQRAVL
jgi:hypothetical protein